MARDATEHEKQQVLLAYKNTQGYPDPEDCGNVTVAIIEHYTTDSPGYSGPLAVAIWGGSPAWVSVFIWKGGEWVLEMDSASLLER